ncbi:MAG: glucosyltransferase domain-containing protein [Eubacteriales bacterium]|nr:glucosyltransferase domain-containing protein [Eubacteriales bacterium]
MEWKQRLEGKKPQLITALAATFLIGLAAHGYAFFDNNVSHDSLREFHAEILGNDIKMQVGRVLTPLYRDLLGSDVTLPWFNGLLALLWIGLAVFLVVRVFRIESKAAIALVAGIFATNITVSATAATYIHDLDSYMFAMLCSVAAVWLWERHPKGWLMGWALVAVSLGINQSYVFLAVSLCMFACILALMDGAQFCQVLFKGLKAIGMILLGGGAYILILKGMLLLSGSALSSGDYNSLDQVGLLTVGTIGPMIIGAYADWFSRLWNAYSSYPGILIKAMTVLFFAIDAAALVVFLFSKQRGWKEKLLCVALVALLPLGMNMIYVLSLGESHELAVYPIWTFYLLTLLLARWLCVHWKDAAIPVGVWQKALCMLMIGAVLYGNVRFSNGMYVKKNLEFDGYLSLMTRVVCRMEATPGYQPGETPVLFVGLPKTFNQVIPGFKDYWNVTGMTGSSPIYTTEPSRLQAYFDYVMSLPIVMAEGEARERLMTDERVQAMPCYPTEGFLAFYDGVLVVKLGDITD